jgi:hypothetical protein
LRLRFSFGKGGSQTLVLPELPSIYKGGGRLQRATGASSRKTAPTIEETKSGRHRIIFFRLTPPLDTMKKFRTYIGEFLFGS